MNINMYIEFFIQLICTGVGVYLGVRYLSPLFRSAELYLKARKKKGDNIYEKCK